MLSYMSLFSHPCCLSLMDLSLLFAPSRCGHCKQFAPEYEKIAQTLKENDPPIPVAKVDASKASSLGSRFDVSGYPTIKILKKGEPVDYDGDRNEKGRGDADQTECMFFHRIKPTSPCLSSSQPLDSAHTHPVFKQNVDLN